MGLVVGRAKYIISPIERMRKLESELPEHRELKIIAKNISEEENTQYLIDFKPKNVIDDCLTDGDDNDVDDYLEKNERNK